MIEYESFVAPQYYWDNLTNMRRTSYIKKYYAENGVYPTQEQISAVVLSAEEIETFNRSYYAGYLAKLAASGETPVVPPVEPPQEEIVEIKVGDKLPSFRVTMNKGNDVSDESLQGNASIIMFFHTSCPDCQKLLPTIQRLYDNYRILGVNFALITREEGDDSISNYWYEQGLTMPYSPQSDRSIYNLFASTRIPRVYISDKEGIVQYIYTDSPDVPTYDVLENAILPLIDYEVNASTISGHWVNNNDETHTITLVRNDRTYTMTKDNNTYTGSYYLYVDDNGEPIIRGNYDHDSGDWEHRYFIQDFNYHSNYMKWVATDNHEVVYEFVRQQ